MLVQEIRIGFGQINPVVGDFAHNSEQILNIMHEAAGKVDLLVFGELALCGYPLGDLSYRADIITATQEALYTLVSSSANGEIALLTVVLGHVSAATAQAGQQSSYASAHNSATVFAAGEVIGRYDKKYLPNYDVFDDWRNFVPGSNDLFFDLKGLKVAVAICEDIWHPEAPQLDKFAGEGVELLVVPNLKAFPINEAFSALSLISELFLFLSFAIFRRILKSSKSGINFMLPILLLDLGQQPLIDSLLFQALSHHKVYAF